MRAASTKYNIIVSNNYKNKRLTVQPLLMKRAWILLFGMRDAEQRIKFVINYNIIL